ncbi:RNA-directed DNA polymerase, eukaryota, reverse transcriptase zinc-binding domain protein [Tanacetum coccineum]
MERGLRQGDPLSPFLFLLVAKALQVMMIDACNKGIFKGLSLANDGANMSLLQYGDDALFMGEWSKSNAHHLVHILSWFDEVSGLKINLAKSRIFSIGVHISEVESIARSINCSHDSLLFSYLGLPVGRSMRKVEDWACVSSKFTKRLTSWKNRLLSIGCRSTLTKSVLDGEKKITWVCWNKVMSNIKDGGLGMGSIKAKNLALIGKWRWRFLVEHNALWRKVISEIHGSDGGFMESFGSVAKPSLWGSITKCCKGLQHFDISLDTLIQKKVMSGTQTSFWTDSWIKDCGPLKVRFPRLYALETHKSCKVADRFINMNGNWISRWSWRRQPTGRSEGDLVSLNNVITGIVLDPLHDDKWVWSLNDSESFSVKSLRVAIQNKMFYNNIAAPKFTWNSWVPRKVNICVWRLALDRLPTRSNLVRRGIQLDSSSCLFCGAREESRDHCFRSCPIIKLLWFKIWDWWGIPPLFNPCLDEILIGNFNSFSKKQAAKLFHVVCFALIWHIWGWRNKILHACSDSDFAALQDIFPSVQRMSLLWVSNRVVNNSFSCDHWIHKPNEVGVT